MDDAAGRCRPGWRGATQGSGPPSIKSFHRPEVLWHHGALPFVGSRTPGEELRLRAPLHDRDALVDSGDDIQPAPSRSLAPQTN
jgi:hypothetical protein